MIVAIEILATLALTSTLAISTTMVLAFELGRMVTRDTEQRVVGRRLACVRSR